MTGKQKSFRVQEMILNYLHDSRAIYQKIHADTILNIQPDLIWGILGRFTGKIAIFGALHTFTLRRLVR